MKTLRLVIVEDEAVIARDLAHLIENMEPGMSIAAMLSSVSEGTAWFLANPGEYDLVFMDIRLADGLSFEIFKKAAIIKPVIFVTAFDDYAIEAFKHNGIDYILKPFDEQEIEKAIEKYRNLSLGANPELNTASIELLLEQINKVQTYKRSFLVHFRSKLIPVEAARIAWFYTANEIIYARTTDARQYIMQYTMEQLEKELDPQFFFRANRQFIINRSAILEVDFHFNGRLSINVKPEPEEQIIISKARATEFKNWMNR